MISFQRQAVLKLLNMIKEEKNRMKFKTVSSLVNGGKKKIIEMMSISVCEASGTCLLPYLYTE